MKDFLSKNFVYLLIGIFVILGFFKGDLFDFGSSTETPLKKGDFFVHNHSAIHAIYYQGDLKDTELKSIADLMNQRGLFENYKPAVLGVIKTNQSIDLLRMTSEEYQKGVPEELISGYSWVALSTKSSLFPNHTVSLKFTDNLWNPHQILDENQIREKAENSAAIDQQTVTPSSDGSLQQILDKWMTGATRLAQASYFFPVESNDNWRIYYSDLVSEQVSDLAQVLAEAKFFQSDKVNYLAFYTVADPDYFKGEAAYALAIPFTETQLDDGSAEKTIDIIHKFLKDGYFSQANFLILATNYDFEPQIIQY
jgi:hypothetical protein